MLVQTDKDGHRSLITAGQSIFCQVAVSMPAQTLTLSSVICFSPSRLTFLAFTLILCSWSTLCLNLPAPHESHWKINLRKVLLTGLALLGAEYIFAIAYGQYLSAKRSIEEFEGKGYDQWTMRHAFFADAGGFVLETADIDARPFPLDAKQLHYLVQRGHLKLPLLSQRDITDRDKFDPLLRLLTAMQTIWFFVNVFVRYVQGLTITSLELTTSAFIVCSVLTVWVWRHKPLGVISPIIVKTDKRLEEILVEAGRHIDDYYSRTPLDFVSQEEWQISKMWSHFINIMRCLGVDFGPKVKPVDRLQETNFLILQGRAIYIFYFVSFSYGAIFVLGWNMTFPTHVEQFLWRTATMSITAGMVVAITGNEVAYTLYPRYRSAFGPHWEDFLAKIHFTHRMQSLPFVNKCQEDSDLFIAWFRNNTPDNDPAMDIDPVQMLVCTILGAVYTAARIYIFVADLLELRSLPSNAYQTVEWTNYVPHL